MDVFVRANAEVKTVQCDLIRGCSHHVPKDWAAYLCGEGCSFEQRDTVEFAESAVSKWQLYDAHSRVARSEDELRAQITIEPSIDTLGIITASAGWWPLSDWMGFCQFRRTWSHNLAIDYLAVHPALLNRPPPVSGVGTALLYRTAVMAKNLGIKAVWLETTDLSAPFYARVFGTSPASDHVVIPTRKFHGTLHRRFAGVARRRGNS